ncbi:MAG: DEAD/DEAH box helicase [Peptococcaceae bacterium]|jgi:ATP-dependent RNA helicase DeaD|nr:DEAD/DEAH box helicase [Peptococcaceae bacterium]
MAKFNELGISEPVLRAISEMGFEEATPIQQKAIPLALAGKDIIGQAQTGTGKTAAFGIPMIEHAFPAKGYIQAIVITPTRELAIQVAEELNRIGQFKGIRSLPIYGGQDINRQIRALKNRPQVIVGTPGRLMDHMRRRTIRLEQVRLAVLDEADEMLSMGFVEDIENILTEVPAKRQTMLFSATMPKAILDLANRFLQEPEFIGIKSREMTVPQIEQYYIESQEKQKFDILCRLLDIDSPESAIVFGRTKRRVDELYEALTKRGYSAEGIHGDLTQARRDLVMKHFKEGLTEILVATDVAARGLDISGVTHVYNFDIPQDPESYVHRIGRTGRAGKTGQALTLVTPREMGHLRLIEQVAKRKIARKPLPSFSDALAGQQRVAVEKILKTLEDEDIHRYKSIAEELLENNDSTTLLSAALKLLTKEPDTTPVRLTEENPLRMRQARTSHRKPNRALDRNRNKYYSRDRRG